MYLDQAQEIALRLKTAVTTGDWEEVPELDQQLRVVFDLALKEYSNATDEEQRVFRERGGSILSVHSEILQSAESRLNELRNQVSEALKSGQAAKTYAKSL